MPVSPLSPPEAAAPTRPVNNLEFIAKFYADYASIDTGVTPSTMTSYVTLTCGLDATTAAAIVGTYVDAQCLRLDGRSGRLFPNIYATDNTLVPQLPQLTHFMSLQPPQILIRYAKPKHLPAPQSLLAQKVVAGVNLLGSALGNMLWEVTQVRRQAARLQLATKTQLFPTDTAEAIGEFVGALVTRWLQADKEYTALTKQLTLRKMVAKHLVPVARAFLASARDASVYGGDRTYEENPVLHDNLQQLFKRNTVCEAAEFTQLMAKVSQVPLTHAAGVFAFFKTRGVFYQTTRDNWQLVLSQVYLTSDTTLSIENPNSLRGHSRIRLLHPQLPQVNYFLKQVYTYVEHWGKRRHRLQYLNSVLYNMAERCLDENPDADLDDPEVQQRFLPMAAPLLAEKGALERLLG